MTSCHFGGWEEAISTQGLGTGLGPWGRSGTNMAESGEPESPLTVNSSAEIDIEGDITVPGAPDSDDEPSTLDEPVSETLV